MNILVIAPHADDEVLGCGGMIARRTSEGHRVDVVVVATGGIKGRHLDYTPGVAQRLNEFEQSCNILGAVANQVLYLTKDMMMDTIPQLELVTKLDEVLDFYDFDEVYIPCPGFNHDHAAVYNAAYAALRLTTGRRPPSLVALYEYTFSAWNPGKVHGGKMYVELTSEHMIKKLEAFAAYKSQVKPAPHPSSLTAIKILAQQRGIECGADYAELFYIQRMIA